MERKRPKQLWLRRLYVIGGHAIHIPFHITWDHEAIDPSEAEQNGYLELEDITQLPAVLKR